MKKGHISPKGRESPPTRKEEELVRIWGDKPPTSYNDLESTWFSQERVWLVFT